MRRITSLLLLALFSFNIIGYYFVFLFVNAEHKKTVQTALFKGKPVETLYISKSEMKSVVFKDKGKEILYKGNMYDIKSISETNGYFVFHCVKDKKETKLLAGLHAFVKLNSDKTPLSEKKQDDTSKNPGKDLFFQQNTPEWIATGIKIGFPSSINHLTSHVSPPLPPPPPEVLIL